jgi:hypothetical protein
MASSTGSEAARPSIAGSHRKGLVWLRRLAVASTLAVLTGVTVATTGPSIAAATPPSGYGTGPGYCTQYAGGVTSQFSIDNVYACDGTTTGSTTFDSPGGGVYAWQCVELSARYLWAIHGVWAGPGSGYSFGYQLVDNVHSRYPSIGVGSPGPGSVPVPGDVISLGPGGFTDPSAGHTAVVTASDTSTGAFTIMSENFPDGTAGSQNLQVDLAGGHNGEVTLAGKASWTSARWLLLRSGEVSPRPVPATIFNPSTGLEEAYYRGPNGQLYETYFANSKKFTQDVGVAMTGDPATLYNPSTGLEEIYYRGPNGQLYETYFANSKKFTQDIGAAMT